MVLRGGRRGGLRRRFRPRKGARVYRGKRYVVRRRVLNPRPTFVETFKSSDPIVLTPGNGAGKAFKVRITDIPQIANYTNLYTQYRINWFKVMLVPKFNTSIAEPNMANYDAIADISGGKGVVIVFDLIRICWLFLSTDFLYCCKAEVFSSSHVIVL